MWLVGWSQGCYPILDLSHSHIFNIIVDLTISPKSHAKHDLIFRKTGRARSAQAQETTRKAIFGTKALPVIIIVGTTVQESRTLRDPSCPFL